MWDFYIKKFVMTLIILTLLLIMSMPTLFAEETQFYITMKVNSEGGTITSEHGGFSSELGFTTYIEKGKELKIYLSPDEGYELGDVH